jgi:hypothetical protein
LETWPKYPLSGKPAWGFRVFVSICNVGSAKMCVYPCHD